MLEFDIDYTVGGIPIGRQNATWTALKLSLWAKNIQDACKEKGKGIHKLSEKCGLVINTGNSQKYLQGLKHRKYAFTKPAGIAGYDKKNLLKEMIFTSSHFTPDSGQKFAICFHLEFWKILPDGRQNFYQPDVDRMFPSNSHTIIRGLLRNGWISKHLVVPNEFTLTAEGGKLPKVKTVLGKGEDKTWMM